MNSLKLFFWICLQDLIIWKSVFLSFNTCENVISEKLNKDLFFDEINQLKIFLNLEKMFE